MTLGDRSQSGWLVAVLAAVALMATPAWAAGPGELDGSFGRGGHVVVQANAGCREEICVEFGGSYADAVALQPDGGIVLGGYDSYIIAPRPSTGEVPGALVRLSPNGALDTSFGSNGVESTPFRVQQIDTDATGGLGVTGTIEGGRIGLARYTPAGVLDGSFAPQGVRWISRPTSWREDQRDGRGRIVVLFAPTPVSIGVVRYLSSGVLDHSFGYGGYAGVHVPETRREAKTPPGFLTLPEVTPLALATEPNGVVLIAFVAASYEPNGANEYATPRYFLERLTPTGRLDRSFGRDGIVRLPGPASKVAIAPNGHILAAYVESTKRRSLRSNHAGERLVLVDYTPVGRIDRGFGRDGVARSQPIATAYQVGIDPRAIAFDAKGDAIVVGELPRRTVDVPSGTGFLARYTTTGIDCSFGTEGVVIDNEIGGASAVAVQPNERIVIAGWSDKAFMAARYMGGGTPRTCADESKH